MKDYIRFQDPENKVPPIDESRKFIVVVIIDNENHDDRMVRLIKNSNDIERDYNWHGEEITYARHPDNWGWDEDCSKISMLIRSHNHWTRGGRSVTFFLVNNMKGLNKIFDEFHVTNPHLKEDFMRAFRRGDYP